MIIVKQKKIGNSYYALIPTDLREKELFIITKEELNQENDKEMEELVKRCITNQDLQNEELLNKINYLENKIDIKDNYRNEKVDLQKFYEDMMLLKNTFFKFKKEMGK